MRARLTHAWIVVATISCGACLAPGSPELTLYSGRSETLVQPVISSFESASGVSVHVRYGGSSQLAATIMEEGADSPADVYFGQDAGALGALASHNRLLVLPAALLERVDPRFRARDGRWVGTSGRARVLAYAASVSEDELPDSLDGLTEPRWKGRVGWAPSNGSFQAFVTAMRVLDGEQHARAWLEGMIANETKTYRDNTPLLEAILQGEIEVGLTNHYYLFRFLDSSDEEVSARNYSPRAGGAGALVNVAGVGIVDSTRNMESARRFVDYLLSLEAQEYFAGKSFEYPLLEGVATHPLLQPLSEIRTPDIDLSRLDDLEGTLALLADVGAL